MTHAQSNAKCTWNLSLSHNTHLPIAHYMKYNTKSFLNILTDKKVVLSLRCPRFSPKGVPPLNYLPLSLHLCGPHLQRPTVNRQRIRDKHSRGKKNTERHRTSGQQTHVRALLWLCYTKVKGLGGTSYFNVTA